MKTQQVNMGRGITDLLLSVWRFSQSTLTVWQLILLWISYNTLKQTVFGGLHFTQWVKVGVVSGMVYVNELMQNAPIIGGLF